MQGSVPGCTGLLSPLWMRQARVPWEPWGDRVTRPSLHLAPNAGLSAFEWPCSPSFCSRHTCQSGPDARRWLQRGSLNVPALPPGSVVWLGDCPSARAAVTSATCFTYCLHTAAAEAGRRWPRCYGSGSWCRPCPGAGGSCSLRPHMVEGALGSLLTRTPAHPAPHLTLRLAQSLCPKSILLGSECRHTHFRDTRIRGR